MRNLRARLALESHAKVLANERASSLARLAASAGVYQQIGLAVDDALVTLVSWSTWARSPDLNLADIFARVSLRSVPDATPLQSKDLEAFWLNGPVMDFAIFLCLFGRWLHKARFPELSIPERPDDHALRTLFADNLAALERRAKREARQRITEHGQ